MAGVWKRDGTVAVTNGNKKVTGTGTTFADTKNGVAKGHLFCITSGTSVDFYEVDYVVSNTELYLVQAYRGVTATGKAYEIITTFSDSVPEFARRLTATLSAYQQQSDAFQALLTSTATTVEVTAPDGTKQTLIPWKRVTSEGEGQAARAKTEADKAAASAALAGDIVAASALPLPDVWAPLSDSLRLITGYGRDVLVGSDVVARMVNFSRNSTATYIGKDGQLKTAAANEPRFEKEGLLIEGQSTNLIMNSETITFPPTGDITSVEYDTATMPGFRMIKQTCTGATGGGSLQTANTSIGSLAVGDVLVFSAVFKMYEGQAGRFRLRIQDGSAFYADSSFYTDLRNESYTNYVVTKTQPFADKSLVKVSVARTITTATTGAVLIQLQAMQVVGITHVGCLQVEKLPFASSYIPTNGAAATRAADVCFIPELQNIYSGGTNVSFCCEVDTKGGNNRIFEAGNATLFVISESGLSGRVSQIAIKSIVTSYILGSRAIVAASISPARVTSRLNGIVVSGVPAIEGSPEFARLQFGNSSATLDRPLNGHIRNFRIWHSALTDEQIKALK